MKSQTLRREELLERIIEWARMNNEIRALVLVGSGARGERPADEWSDIDLVIVTTQPDRYRLSSYWTAPIGRAWIDTVERGPAGEIVERRVLFDSAIDVDFIIASADDPSALEHEPLASILRGGAHVLVDKDTAFPNAGSGRPSEAGASLPSPEAFAEVVNDFWFHVAWAAKKIRRGELYTAKSCVDGYLKRLLLTMIEWREFSSRGARTWYSGRFIEHWASPGVLEGLRGAFAHYDEQDLWRALSATRDLFDALARETASRIGTPYPEEAAQEISRWLASIRPHGLISP